MKKLLKKKQPGRPNPIPVEQLSKLRMVAGNERKIRRVIDDGIVKEWVAIGWIELRPATRDDYLNIPAVKR